MTRSNLYLLLPWGLSGTAGVYGIQEWGGGGVQVGVVGKVWYAKGH